MSILHRALRPLFTRAWKPLTFRTTGFTRIPATEKIEEETLPGYVASRYYPVHIGEIFRARYQIVGKLGYGATSNVWLARDLSERRHVALKLFINSKAMGEQHNELDVYKRIESVTKCHPGRNAVRPLLDSFKIDGPNGQFQCLVHPPLWNSILSLRRRNPILRLPAPILAFTLKRLFLALDFLHNVCHIAHTDIKEANILLGADDSVLTAFEELELTEPCPRKALDGRTVYLSRELDIPTDVGAPVLCDFGSAVRLDDGVEHREDIQPDVYRAPEVILDIPWSYSVDMWNVGCMISDAFEGEHLFTGHDTEFDTYRGRAHLAEMIALLGPPPAALLARANLRSKFFSDEGNFRASIPVPEAVSLEQRETTLAGEDKDCFLHFMRKMLKWEPELRSSPRELAEDEWIIKHTT